MFVVCISDREEREERGSVFPPCNDKDFLWLEDGEPAVDAAISLVVALSVSQVRLCKHLYKLVYISHLMHLNYYIYSESMRDNVSKLRRCSFFAMNDNAINKSCRASQLSLCRCLWT